MSVYKEGFYWLAELSNQQVQIWEDACDYGIPVKKNDKNWNLAKQIVEWYGGDGKREAISYTGGKSVKIDFTLLDEWQTKREVPFMLAYCTMEPDMKHPGCDGYITVVAKNELARQMLMSFGAKAGRIAR